MSLSSPHHACRRPSCIAFIIRLANRSGCLLHTSANHHFLLHISVTHSFPHSIHCSRLRGQLACDSGQSTIIRFCAPRRRRRRRSEPFTPAFWKLARQVRLVRILQLVAPILVLLDSRPKNDVGHLRPFHPAAHAAPSLNHVVERTPMHDMAAHLFVLLQVGNDTQQVLKGITVCIGQLPVWLLGHQDVLPQRLGPSGRLHPPTQFVHKLMDQR